MSIRVASEPSSQTGNTIQFTLVELLVVVAIIVILMAILLPALRKAKETASRITCVNNQKQMLLGITQYTDDSNGWFAPLANTYTRPGTCFRMYSEYCGGPGYLKTHYDGPTKEELPIFYCPALTVNPGNGKTYGYREPPQDRSIFEWPSFGGYGINNIRVAYAYRFYNSRGAGPELAILGDCDVAMPASWPGSWGSSILRHDKSFYGAGRSSISMRHGGLGNVAQWNGSVSTYDNVSTYSLGTPGSGKGFLYRLWLGNQDTYCWPIVW